MRAVAWVLLSLAAAPPIGAQSAAAKSAQRKLGLIESERAPAGAIYSFSKAEIEAWAAAEIPTVVPDGLRNARVELGVDAATGRALIDFLKLRHAKGAPKNWFLDKLLEGERPVTVHAELRSANGQCTVFLKRLEISGVSATGSVLDFLINNFFLTLYPDAKIGKPFQLRHRMESITVRPEAVYVKINNTPPVKPPAPARAAPKTTSKKKT